MKDEATKMKFIELRIQSKSFDEISKILNVSKQTLIAWNKKYRRDIEKLKLDNYNELLVKYNENSLVKLEGLLKIKEALFNELSSRSFKSVKLKELIELMKYLDSEIDKIVSKQKQVSSDIEFDFNT